MILLIRAGDMAGKPKTPKIVAKTILVMVLFGAVVFFISNNFLTVSSYNLAYDNLPDSFDGFKIVLLSDLHSKSFGKNNEKLVRAVAGESPDIIVMTGDMVNTKDRNFDVFLSLSRKLASEWEIYFIVGNHEQNLSDDKLQTLYDNLNEAGVNVLDNDKTIIQKGSDTLDLFGLWFNLRYYSDQGNQHVKDYPDEYYFSIDKMNKVIDEKDSAAFTILLTHNPVYFDTYVAWGADLTLCGHIHGGMLRLPFIGGIFSPERELLPKYDAGNFSKNSRHMIVSRGLGNGNKGVRFLNCPEIVSITLKCMK